MSEATPHGTTVFDIILWIAMVWVMAGVVGVLAHATARWIVAFVARVTEEAEHHVRL